LDEQELERITGGDPVKGVIVGLGAVESGGGKEGYWLLAKSYFTLGLYKDGILALKEYLKQGGDEEKIRELIPLLPPDAQRVFEKKPAKKEVKEGEFDGNAFLEMANLLWDIGSPEEAKQNYLRAFECFIDEGNPEKAEEILAWMKERFPGDPDIASLSVPKESLFDKLSSIQFPEDPEREGEVRLRIAEKMHEEGMIKHAVSELEKVIKIKSPARTRAINLLYDILRDREKGRLINLFEEAASLPLTDEEKLNLYYKLGMLYEEEGRKEKAEEYWRWIYTRKPDYMDVKERLRKEKKEAKVEEKPVPVLSVPVKKVGEENIQFL